MNEKDIFLYYFNNTDGMIKYYIENDKTWIERFLKDENKKICFFESPDILIETSSKYLLLEHFQFDSSKRVKRSSLLKEEEAKVNREYDRMLSSKVIDEGINEFLYSANFETEISLEDFEKNLIESFEVHIKKYDDYIKKFKSSKVNKSKEFEFGFVIQNTSMLIDIAYNGIYRIHLTPFHLKKFRDNFRKYPHVKHIFYLTEDSEKKIVLYFSYESLKYIEDIIETVDNTYKITPWKPRHLRYTVFYQRKQKEDKS